jgi:hypothetical protein
LAALCGIPEFVQLLLEEYCPFQQRFVARALAVTDNRDVFFVLEECKLVDVKLMLLKGCKYGSYKLFFYFFGKGTRSDRLFPESFRMRLLERAIKHGHLALVLLLKSTGIRIPQSAACVAASRRHLLLLEYLINSGEDLRNPMQSAAGIGGVTVVQFLLDRGLSSPSLAFYAAYANAEKTLQWIVTENIGQPGLSASERMTLDTEAGRLSPSVISLAMSLPTR